MRDGLGEVEVLTLKHFSNIINGQEKSFKEIYKDTIDRVYNENVFSLFRKYCASNGIRYMADLKDFDFNRLYSVTGLGKAKISKIIQRWQDYVFDKRQHTHVKHPVTIVTFFSEGKFNLFRKYCQKKGLVYVKELEGFNFDNLYQVNGIGEGKINEIKQRWEIFLSNYQSNKELVSPYVEPGIKKLVYRSKEINIHRSNHNFDINLLNLLGVNKKIIEWLNNNGFQRLGDLEDLNLRELIQVPSIAGNMLNVFREKIGIFDQPIDFDILFREAWRDLKQQHCMEVLTQRAYGYTLQELGDRKGVSRERIRQIEIKALKKVKQFIKMCVHYILSKFQCKQVLTFDDLESLFNNQEDAMLLYYALVNNVTKR